jgi:hypothetical protein
MTPKRIAVAGAGQIGARHIEEVDASGAAQLASIVDPGPAGSQPAAKFNVRLYQDLADLFARDKPDGVILATPNQLHVGDGRHLVHGQRGAGRSRRAYRDRAPAGRGPSRKPAQTDAAPGATRTAFYPVLISGNDLRRAAIRVSAPAGFRVLLFSPVRTAG